MKREGIPEMTGTTNENPREISRGVFASFTVEKITPKAGMYTAAAIAATDTKTARISFMLEK